MRVRTPTIIQMEAVECGSTCLGIVLAYYQRYVSLEILRSQCDVGRDGSNALNLIKVARTYGLTTRGVKCEVEKLSTYPLPLILFWDFNHFVVLEGLAANGDAFLNDPAVGPRKVSAQVLKKSFTGVALTMVPGDDFKKGGKPKSIFRSLRRRLVGLERGLALVILVSFAMVLPGLVTPAFMKVFMDEILNQGQHDWILALLGIMLVTCLVQFALNWLRGHFLQRLQASLAISSSARFLWHVLWLPVEFYSQRNPGEIASRVALNDKVAELLTGKLAKACMNTLMVFVYAAVMWMYDSTLTLIALALAFINFSALSLVSRRRKDISARLLQETGKLTAVTMGGLQAIETLKATGRENDFFASWSGHLARVIKVQQDLGLSSQAVSLLPNFVSGLGTLAILCVGGLRIMDGALTVGLLTAFQGLMGNFIGPVNEMVTTGSDIQEVESDMNRLDDVLVNPADRAESEGPETYPAPLKLQGRVELRDLTFGYSQLKPPLIKDFNLTIEPGQRIALVGATGSGKSTIVRLLMGLFKKWSGEVLFDGKAREEIPRIIMTSSLAHVDQDIKMFGGTVRDNLTLWDPTVSEGDLIRALKDAHIFDTLMARPGGLDGPVREGLTNFSGGERQRLEIARALVCNPSILIMDEATSALDPLVERKIDASLRTRGCTCIIVAHRLSTIRDADKILVMEQGRVIQSGTHDQLCDQPGHYQDLMKADPGSVGS